MWPGFGRSFVSVKGLIMSMLAIIACGGFAVVALAGIGMGLKGAMSDSPPYMKGEGQVGRFDPRLNKAA